jgi:hypothetical protein
MEAQSSNLSVELENRLVRWAYWIIPFEKNEVGFPQQATIADFGLPDSSIRQSKPPFPLNNLNAQEMNCWINIMGTEHPEYKETLRAYYLRGNKARMADIAKTLNTSRRVFEQRLILARTWLRGRLSVEHN